MEAGDLLTSFESTAWRHIPSGSPYGVLDFRFAGLRSDGRWHYRGQPTLYLAGSKSTAFTELSRHIAEDRAGIPLAIRDVYELKVRLEAVLDLRDPRVANRLRLDSLDYLQERKTRAIANLLRTDERLQGLVVPPVGMLDRPQEWNLVVFLERFPAELPAHVVSTRLDGVWSYETRPQD